MIAIVDYGLGNVQAIANIYKRLNIPTLAATTSANIENADRIVLPGVGAFDWAMARLNSSGMREALDKAVQQEKKPVLGICVGMQMMAKKSEEGVQPGLGWIDAEVKKFEHSRFTQRTHLPHMGWNDVLPKPGAGLFRGLETSAQFYFLHSYYFVPHRDEDVLAETDYNGRYASSVSAGGNVYGVQFHPEKSHQWGIQLLKNFSEI